MKLTKLCRKNFCSMCWMGDRGDQIVLINEHGSDLARHSKLLLKVSSAISYHKQKCGVVPNQHWAQPCSKLVSYYLSLNAKNSTNEKRSKHEKMCLNYCKFAYLRRVLEKKLANPELIFPTGFPIRISSFVLLLPNLQQFLALKQCTNTHSADTNP